MPWTLSAYPCSVAQFLRRERISCVPKKIIGTVFIIPYQTKIKETIWLPTPTE